MKSQPTQQPSATKAERREAFWRLVDSLPMPVTGKLISDEPMTCEPLADPSEEMLRGPTQENHES